MQRMIISCPNATGFEELSCYKANQGAGERPHMDLGAFNKYLEDHDLKFAFRELFDVEAK